MGVTGPDDQRRPAAARHVALAAAPAAVLACLLGAAVLAGGCRPETVTGARDQLGRSEARTVSYRVPVVQEEYDALRFLQGVVTRVLADGLIAVPLSPDSVRAFVGPDLLDDAEARLAAFDEIDPSAVDLGELEEGVAASEVRTAPVEASLRSTLSVPLRVVDPFLAAVRLDESGDPEREPSGALDLEEGDDGTPLTVPLADAPGDSLVLEAGGRVEVQREGAPLVDRIVDLVVAGDRVAAVLGGVARVSGADRPAVDPSDVVVLDHRLLVGLDLVLPDTGIVVRRNEIGTGVSLGAADAADLEDRVVRAGGTLSVANGVPFRIETRLAWIPGRRPDADVFADPDRVTLDLLAVGTGAVDDGGRVTGERRDTLDVALTGEEVRPLLEDAFTAGVRIRLLPPGGPGGRGALTLSEDVEMDADAFIDLRSGG